MDGFRVLGWTTGWTRPSWPSRSSSLNVRLFRGLRGQGLGVYGFRSLEGFRVLEGLSWVGLWGRERHLQLHLCDHKGLAHAAECLACKTS
eukprot:146175-Prorocentrum_minimum.AAC.2